MKRPLAIIGVFGVLQLLSIQSARSSDQIQTLTFEFEVFHEEICSEYREDRAELYDKYATAVDQLGGSLQATGDLDSTLKAKEEAKLARNKRKPGKTDFPGIERLRTALEQASTGIDKAAKNRSNKLAQEYIRQLNELQGQYTKEGNVEEALEARGQIDDLVDLISSPKSVFDTLTTYKPSKTEKAIVAPEAASTISTGSILHSTVLVTGSHQLEPGAYTSFERLQLGDRSIENKADRGGQIHIPTGCELSEGIIYGDVGAIDLSGSHFHDMEFWQNLHSNLKADSCRFDRCHFKKGGGWGAAISSRWIFENCVITESFFRVWRKKLVGLQARASTFDGIQFPPYEFKVDAGKEAASEWWIYERCLFRNCSIPESLLIATRDCVFENCEIVSETLLIETPVSISLYERGTSLKLPSAQGKVSYKKLSESKLSSKQIGSDLTD